MTTFCIANLRSSLLAFALSFALCLAASAADPSLSFQKAAEGIIVAASKVPEGSEISLHLVDSESGNPGPAMLCDLQAQGPGQLTLTPRFDLVAGSTYRALLKTGDQVIAEIDWKTADSSAPTPRVMSISPSSEALPANLLKFYVTFSEPMRGGRGIFDHFHIHNESGKRVEAPWRQQELWSDDHRTLTLWIHPGRVKQGVNLRTTMGPVLLPGQHYSLLIENGLLSLPGKPTLGISQKKFTTIAEDHQRPSAKEWILTPPVAGSAGPVIIESPEPLDTWLARRYLTITDANAEPVATRVAIESTHRNHNEKPGRLFAISPANGNRWRDETYTLHAGEFLEDLAGNTPTRVFDTDLDDPAPEATGADLQRTFRPLPAEK